MKEVTMARQEGCDGQNWNDVMARQEGSDGQCLRHYLRKKGTV
jgi:hypothetical protein